MNGLRFFDKTCGGENGMESRVARFSGIGASFGCARYIVGSRQIDEKNDLFCLKILFDVGFARCFA